MKTKILSRIPVSDVAHARQLCIDFQNFYNTHRAHQSLNGNFPGNQQEDIEIRFSNEIYKTDMMGGLVTIFTEGDLNW